MTNTIPSLLENLCRLNKTFFFYEDTSINYSDFCRNVDKLATGFLDLGLEHGDRIAIISPNQPEWIYTFFAANKIGLGVVALNIRYREAELDYMLKNSEARAVVCYSEFAGFNYKNYFEEAKIPSLEYEVYLDEGEITFTELLKRTDSDVVDDASRKVSEMDTSVIIYTSGTTGRPKGANITHRSLLSSAKAQRDHTNATESDIISLHLPLNHVGGLTCTLLTSMTARGSVVVIPYFDPTKVLESIERHRVTVFGGVPTMYQMLFLADFDRYDVSSIRLAIIGGSEPRRELVEKIKNKFKNAKIVHLYGLSESSGACLLSYPTRKIDELFDEKGMPAIGVPIDEYKVKIVDESGKEMPDGEVGEITVKGDCVCNGYIGLEKETAETFSGGWLFTGDMGYKKGEMFYFMGRKKEMFVQAGYNVYPAEVENVILSHPKVVMVAVVGVSDEFYGQKGVAFVVPSQDVSAEELKNYCSRYIADYKIPREFIFVKSLPLTPVGKIQKSELLKLYGRLKDKNKTIADGGT